MPSAVVGIGPQTDGRLARVTIDLQSSARQVLYAQPPSLAESSIVAAVTRIFLRDLVGTLAPAVRISFGWSEDADDCFGSTFLADPQDATSAASFFTLAPNRVSRVGTYGETFAAKLQVANPTPATIGCSVVGVLRASEP